jgi:hypothetical protein
MKTTMFALLTAGLLAAAPALAVDGHGNAANPEQMKPNLGTVSGGPNHSDDPRVREAQEKGPDGKPLHSDTDGHAHGHSHGKK